MNDKIIFLDNDGVVCLAMQWGTRAKKIKRWNLENPDVPAPASVKMDNFDIKAVKILNTIIEETGADIVVSSDWKLYCSLEELKQMFTDYGVCKQPIDCTPNHHSSFKSPELRVGEINEWLEKNPHVVKWVAIDDMDLSALKNFVHTKKMNEGIKQSGIKEKIIKMLK